jgi:uncharacterized protein YfaS (alpha-2-macroglobulin family)
MARRARLIFQCACAPWAMPDGSGRQIEAGGKSFDDAVAATLKIGSPVPVLHETYLTDLASTANDLLDGVNPQVLEGEGAVRVTLSNTRLASLRETAAALLEYPYGCAEQTVSSLIPWITLNELGPVLPDLAKSKEDVRKAIRAGLDKIFAMQTPSGGLAYWPVETRRASFPVPTRSSHSPRWKGRTKRCRTAGRNCSSM